MTPCTGFEPPSALDLLAEFRTAFKSILQYGSGYYDNGVRIVDRFEPMLHRMIQAFITEAMKPYMSALSDAASRQLPPHMFMVDKATLEQLPPVGDRELWRGQHRGVWYRVVIMNGYRPEFQVSFNASLGEEVEVWQENRAL